METNSKNVVMVFIAALNDENFEVAQGQVNDSLRFEGVMGARDGAEAYFNDMRKMKFKYDIIKAFEDGEDVCLLYSINMGEQTIFSAGWYALKDGKIESIKVVFDPRPLLEGKS